MDTQGVDYVQYVEDPHAKYKILASILKDAADGTHTVDQIEPQGLIRRSDEIRIHNSGRTVLTLNIYGACEGKIDGFIGACSPFYEFSADLEYWWNCPYPEVVTALIPVLRLAGVSEAVIEQVEDRCHGLNRKKYVIECEQVLRKSTIIHRGKIVIARGDIQCRVSFDHALRRIVVCQFIKYTTFCISHAEITAGLREILSAVSQSDMMMLQEV